MIQTTENNSLASSFLGVMPDPETSDTAPFMAAL